MTQSADPGNRTELWRNAGVWRSAEVADELRRRNERDTFSKRVDDVVKSWPRFIEGRAKHG